MARKGSRSSVTRGNALQYPLRQNTGFKSSQRRASFSAPTVTTIARQARTGNPKTSTHPLHDPTGTIHAMTGARLTGGVRSRMHSAVTHLRPYKIPKGI